MTEITLSRVTDWADLGQRWRALEERSDCSFFQSWTWTGCRAEERFPDPVLLEAKSDGRVVVMALFNRRRTMTGQQTLWLGESGRRDFDAIYIEWNGLLVETGTPPRLLADCLRAARRAPLNGWRPWVGRRLVLSGVDEPTMLAAQTADGHLEMLRQSSAPYVDLAALRQRQQPYLAALSGNTRYQLRRSARAYAATGELELRRAASLDEAMAYLNALTALHQTTWTRRGRSGAF
jgi:CelD/BcsL family acetyltransferase involved in cellulose biosynthesis